jgi:hypothetical protein
MFDQWCNDCSYPTLFAVHRDVVVDTSRLFLPKSDPAWRQVGVMPLQQYLEACRFPYRPCPRHMVTAAAELDARIRPVQAA